MSTTGVLGHVARRRHARGVRSCRGTARRRSTGTSPPTTAGTRRPHEVAVRQVRVGGTPVFETRLRMPGGDAVHRTWSVADAGGLTLVEVANESPLPIAVAFTRADLRTTRPPADVPIQGIDLPADATIVLPVGHRTSVTVGAGPRTARRRPLPPAAARRRRRRTRLAGGERAGQPARPPRRGAARAASWRALRARHSPGRPTRPTTRRRSCSRSASWCGWVSPAARWVDDVAAAVEPRPRRRGGTPTPALRRGRGRARRAGERRAVATWRAIVAGRAPAPPPAALARRDPRRGGRRGTAAARRAAAPRRDPGRVARRGVRGPRPRRSGRRSTVSFAVRWHGEHPAVLWEVAGEPVELTAPAVDPAWRTAAPTGEALWPASAD